MLRILYVPKISYVSVKMIMKVEEAKRQRKKKRKEKYEKGREERTFP